MLEMWENPDAVANTLLHSPTGSRLRDRLVDVEAKAQAEAVRCISLEKESRTFEELMRLRGETLSCHTVLCDAAFDMIFAQCLSMHHHRRCHR